MQTEPRQDKTRQDKTRCAPHGRPGRELTEVLQELISTQILAEPAHHPNADAVRNERPPFQPADTYVPSLSWQHDSFFTQSLNFSNIRGPFRFIAHTCRRFRRRSERRGCASRGQALSPRTRASAQYSRACRAPRQHPASKQRLLSQLSLCVCPELVLQK